MQAEAVVPPARPAGFHIDPAWTAPAFAALLTVPGAFALHLLEELRGFGAEWRVPGAAMVAVLAVALLLIERRRYLSHPAVEPGATEASWAAAQGDLEARDRLQNRLSVALLALGAAHVPFSFLWWFRSSSGFWFFDAVLGFAAFLLAAHLIARRRSECEGRVQLAAGSAPPAGWWALGALAVGLPLVWLPVVLMAAAEDPRPLLLLAIPALSGATWWLLAFLWRRPLRVDLGLRDVPIDWRRRSRDQGLIVLLWIPFVVLWRLALGDQPAINELIGFGCSAFFVWELWWLMTLAILYTGLRLLLRPIQAVWSPAAGPSPAPQPAASASR
jgi:hypothetical protein